MTRSTPTIHDNTLLLYEEEQAISIVVGSVQWFSWVGKETSTTFSFHSLQGSYTARKERVGNRRGGWYWKAYRKSGGTLYRAYLGKPEDLTVERLGEIARTLATRMQGQAAMPQEETVAGPRPPHQNHSNTTVTPLLSTKLHPPRLPALLVTRERLLTLLDGGQKLILVQAPAGFGKTTLVTQWVAHRESQAASFVSAGRHPSPPVWLSLDRGDNDPIRFWSSLMTACQILDAHLGQRALAHLSQISRPSFSSSSLETALTFLLNDLERSGSPGVVILEDYHLIEHPRIHETMTFFIEHLPSCLQVVLLTRSTPPLPLVRWRARGDLLEVQNSRLRFDASETATFLQQVMPQAQVPEALHRLSTHLEGWAAGLRLLVLSVESHMTEQTIEGALTHLPRGTASHAHRSIQEYFVSEILAAQPESLQRFLLQTSILSRLTGSLCDAVTGRQDSAEWLILVERSGFFLEALDSTWYRYHSIFASTMRTEATRRLGEEALRSLQALASRWYEEHFLPVEAIDAALAAQEFERAVHLIERLNEAASFSEHHTMLGWLKQLPDPLLRVHPTLCFCSAQAQLFLEDDSASKNGRGRIEELLQMAEEGWSQQGEWEKNVAQGAAYARLALQFPLLKDTAPGGHGQRHQTEWADWRCYCLMTLGMEARLSGSFDQAYRFLLEAYPLSLNSSDRMLLSLIKGLLGEVCIELGELHQAASYFQQTLAQPKAQDEGAEALLHANSVWGLIRLSYEWNKVDQAEDLAHEASLYRFRDHVSSWEEETHMKLELARLLVLRAKGSVAEVQAALSALLVRLGSLPNTFSLICEVRAWQARWQIRDGDLAAAERTLGTLARSEKELSLLQRETIRLLHARILLARGETKAALPAFLRLLSDAVARKHLIRVLEIQLLTALAYAVDNQRQEARHQLMLVLSQARHEGFVRFFLDEGEPMSTLLRQVVPTLTEIPLRSYAQSLLSALACPPPPHTKGLNRTEGLLLEPLSVQEQRVLTLLVAGHSNPEIAETLIVSVNTVKAHVKHLYRKLGVTNRMEAGEVARREQLI